MSGGLKSGSVTCSCLRVCHKCWSPSYKRSMFNFGSRLAGRTAAVYTGLEIGVSNTASLT